MLRFLFPRLTRDAQRGAGLFAALVREARRPEWYVEGAVPDTLDGRFNMLATLVAITEVRLEAASEGSATASAALTERFVEAMDAEHRELGLGDPALGRTVRKLVGALARRVELWRDSVPAGDWSGAIADSLFRGDPPAQAALAHCEHRLRDFWARLEAANGEALAQGRM